VVAAGEFAWIDYSNVPGLMDWVAFSLGAAGIGFTVVQLARSRGALKAAAKALSETRATLIRNQLVSVLPAFEEISKSIDAALGSKNREQLQEGFGRFSFRAHEAVSLLNASTTEFELLVEEILNAAESASTARSNLYSDATSALEVLVGDAASSIRNLAPRVSGAAVSIRNDPGKVKQDA
jgi:hypothetical protein